MWLDPAIIAAAATTSGRRGRLLRRQAAARSAGRFCLRVGGDSRPIGLRHGSLLIVEAPTKDEWASTALTDMVVEAGGDGGNNQGAAARLRLVELRFFVSERVRQECTRLGWGGVHRALAPSLPP